MTKRHLPLVGWLAVACLPLPALAQPVGPEFQVNTYTTEQQFRPAVASDANGNFVVVWESYSYLGGQDEHSGGGIFGQRYDSGGNPLGGEFQVNTYTTSRQADAAVASDSNGNFIVVWKSPGQDGDGNGVFGQRYDSSGNEVGVEFQVNTYTTGSQGGPFRVGPSVASGAKGNFVVVWQSYQDRSSYGIFGQRYDSGGNPLGGEFQVNTYTTGTQQNPSVAAAASGNFVVVWQSGGIVGQRYDVDGSRLGGEFQVNTFPAGFDEKPSVAADSSGNFVVVWGNANYVVVGQRYDSDGDPRGGEFTVSLHGFDQKLHPAASSDPRGNFVVTWERYFADKNDWRSHLAAEATGDRPVQPQEAGPLSDPYGIFGQRYDNHGKRLGPEFHVNTYTTGIKSRSSIASAANGNFVVVWDSSLQDGGGGFDGQYGIFGQRFSADCEASLQVQGDVHTPGSVVPVEVHIAHRRPKTVTVPWELRLLDASGQRIVRHRTEPHTFEPGDVVDREVEFLLPNDLTSGTYTLELAISGMAGTKGAATTFQVVGPSSPQ